MPAKIRFAVVNNVNTARDRFADFDIHVEGCKALVKLDPRDIEIIEATDANEVARLNNEEIRGSGSFDEDSEWAHRSHSCVKKAAPASKSGATGPRYSDKQIKDGLAARRAGKTNKEVAEAAGVKSPSYFAKVLKGHGASVNEAVRENNERVMEAEAKAPAKAKAPAAKKSAKGAAKPAKKVVPKSSAGPADLAARFNFKGGRK